LFGKNTAKKPQAIYFTANSNESSQPKTEDKITKGKVCKKLCPTTITGKGPQEDSDTFEAGWRQTTDFEPIQSKNSWSRNINPADQKPKYPRVEAPPRGERDHQGAEQPPGKPERIERPTKMQAESKKPDQHRS
jgi:hypothetical protein